MAKAFVLFALAITAISCTKDEEVSPGTSMEFKVVDELGNSVNGALVQVYSDFEGYVMEDPNKLVSFGETSSEGILLVKGMEPKKYHYSVTHGTAVIKTNWNGAITTTDAIQENKVNVLNVVIQENHLNYLAGEGKSWMVHQIFYNAEDITDGFESCFLDNVITYYKDDTVLFAEGFTKCNGDDPQEYMGTFTISGNSLHSIDEYGQEFSTISELNNNSMTLVQQADNAGNIIQFYLKASYN